MLNPKKLVCIFAHPDDEAFGPGGSIAYFAGEGTDVTIISVTNGDMGKHDLAKIRQHELRESATILGVKKVIFLGYKDGSLCNNNYHNVARDIKSILDKIKPDTLMTFDLNGVSGHIDHVAVAMECSYLFERLRYVKNILYFCNNKAEKKLIGKNYFIYFPEGHDKSDVDLVIDVKDYFDIKKRAMLAHKSQLKDALWLLTFLRKFLKEEFFKVVTK